MNDTMQVGRRLVELCRAGKFLDAIDELYDPEVVSVEASAGPAGSPRTQGKVAVRGKSEWWAQNHEVHQMTVGEPMPHGDRFIVTFALEVTPKAGPMAGKRFKMNEAGLYAVKNGKVVHEEFFYHM